MILAHKIRIYPNEEQKKIIDKSCKVQGFIYNWGLKTWQEQYKNGEKPTAIKLKKLFNSIKEKEFSFVLEVTKCCVEGAFQNLDRAFKNFFNKTSKYPKFKKFIKKNSFYVANDKFSIKNKLLHIPKIKEKVKCSENLRFNGKIMSATISKTPSNKYYISIQVEQPLKDFKETNNQIGLDLGIKDLIITSNNEKYNNPKWICKVEKRLKRKQRSLSRRKKGSKNREKTKLKIAKLNERITNQRKDYLNKISTYIVNTNDKIAIEDLNIKGMLKNHHIAKSLSNVSLYEFIRQLEYKSKLNQKILKKVDRWFPSSKTCSVCGCVNNDLDLNDRVWTCNECGSKLDRDINASLNILREAFSCKFGDRPITDIKNINSIYQIDWMNQKVKCQNNMGSYYRTII